MKKIELRALNRKIKTINYGNEDNVEKVVDYASFVITNASYVFFNGECIVRINGREATSEDELRRILLTLISKNENIDVEILPMRKEITSTKVPSELILHAASITPAPAIKV